MRLALVARRRNAFASDFLSELDQLSRFRFFARRFRQLKAGSMRIGIVVKVLPEKKIGFIRSEDLREDVFFHFSRVEKVGTLDLQVGDEVEYEIEELAKLEKRKLQATKVRRSLRPLTMKIQSSDAPKLRARHHPNARKRRPTWRNDKPTSVDDVDDEPET